MCVTLRLISSIRKKKRGAFHPPGKMPAAAGLREGFVQKVISEVIKESKDHRDAERNKEVDQRVITVQSSQQSELHHHSVRQQLHRSKDATMEKKGILKRVSILTEGSATTQSSSIGPVRWTLPVDSTQPHNSAPSGPTNSNNSLTQHSQHPRQTGLKNLRSLQECVQFIHHWKEQVDQVCKGDESPKEGGSKTEAQSTDRRTERSLEESRKLILEWADELRHVDKLLKTPWAETKQEDEKKEDPKEEDQMRIMEWAKELQEKTESCGVQSDELGKVLRLLGLKKKRLGNLLPLMEFITWSLLKEDSTTMVPQLWLLTKQRTWQAGIPRCIPNSVWSWICSAAADVILDPKTNYPWLLLSEDQRMVQESHCEADLPYSPQRFDSWPCVLGWEGYNSGRHYWEVDIANNGYWRIGMTTAESKREGRFPMFPKQGYWALWRSTNKFYACTKPETVLPTALVPRRMGIYLDYKEGQISFYNAETKTHIYTFTGNFRGKLYPLFAPMDGRTLMRITPPNKISAH
ncbi:E3 ubiquitin-protein ligase TRIM39 isoform X2 [Notolabrus celidotus]|uniref:E3 ubiquitin-protein ligase TRIM39 isoform X2 n=1 Tax=Notolabrus celidotus TaxID=1203425 RepID=UPI0014902C07|nr:E3 ubiquitin-protein ligase TRIM39 isoform X2 [Notolabrus celidotus]